MYINGKKVDIDPIEAIQEYWDDLLLHFQEYYHITKANYECCVKCIRFHKILEHYLFLIIPRNKAVLIHFYDAYIKEHLERAILSVIGFRFSIRFCIEGELDGIFTIEDENNSESNEEELVEAIINMVSLDTGISREEIFGKALAEEYAEPRHIVRYLIVKYSPMKYLTVKEAFDHKDDRATIFSIMYIDNKMRKDSDFQEKMYRYLMDLSVIINDF